MPNYTVLDAARFTRVPYSTVLYWTRGRGGQPPVIRAGKRLSFFNLVEIHMLGLFRRYHRVPLQKLRRALVTLTRRLPGERHPLATRAFWTDGGEVLTRELGSLVSLSEQGQRTLPEVVESYARRIEWQGRMPKRLFVFTTRPEIDRAEESPRNIVIDPSIAFGRPVVAETGIAAQTLYERFEAGETTREIAADFGLELEQVEDAIRCGKAGAAA